MLHKSVLKPRKQGVSTDGEWQQEPCDVRENKKQARKSTKTKNVFEGAAQCPGINPLRSLKAGNG
jgi:hypothetical protein